MSEQADAHLQIPASYNYKRSTVSNYRNHQINSSTFHNWAKDNMYASSYAKHHSPDSVSPRSHHFPGYGGFIPTDRAESVHAKTFANKTKDILAQPRINLNKSGLATTGFNITKEVLIDQSKNASSHKYGKTEIQKSHPAWIPQQWKSTTKATYLPPNQLSNPTHRETSKNAQTSKIKTKTSGFQQNRAYWDGKGWNPHPILNPANITSQYRDRFNPQAQYHRNTHQAIAPQLKKTEYKYKFNK